MPHLALRFLDGNAQLTIGCHEEPLLLYHAVIGLGKVVKANERDHTWISERQ